MPIEGVLFDLDGTLYGEESYVLGAYKDVAAFVSAELMVDSQPVQEQMLQRWRQKGSRYPHIFAETLQRVGVEDDALVAQMVAVFNGHRPRIELYPDAEHVLKTLRQVCKIAIVTDGFPDRQERKIRALGLDDAVDSIVLTGARGFSKPHEDGYAEALKQIEVEAQRAVFVGDSPDIDLSGARRAGLGTVHFVHSSGRPATVGQTATLPWDHVIHRLSALIPIVLGRV